MTSSRGKAITKSYLSLSHLVTAINSWVVRWFHSVQLLRNVQFQNRDLDPREPSSGVTRNVFLNFFVSSRTAVPMLVVLERRESTGLLRELKG